MNKFLFPAAALALAVCSLSSCSDDDPKWENLVESGTYTDAKGLSLTVNGEPMVGKTVVFEQNTANPDKGTITISSTFDLGAIPGVPSSMASTVLDGPGVIPGSAVTVLNVNLVELKGAQAKFQGSDENEYCTFEYNGIVTDNSIDLNITNLKLKNLTLAGTYTLPPYDVNDDWESDEYGTVYYNPIYVNWQSTADFDFLGTPMPVENLVSLLMTMPLLNDMTVRVPDMMSNLLENVTFGEDGNITASYLDLDADKPTYFKSPVNMAQYAVTGENSLRFWLNPQAVIKEATRAETGIDINNLLGNVMAQLTPMLKDGVPMRYKIDNTTTTVYLDTETLLPLLKQNVVPLLKNEALVKQLTDLLEQDEDMAFLATMIPSMISSAANVIENTTVLEIGLNLSTATNK
ncbi:MAG: DUF4925 domain-containing protein [Prevotella sp.]|nr:DUF4925 domain-containing protein [Prevotella sp.]MCM1075188.1 DUF4925 domain-containing protein [Ruminococcus sp.]